MAIAEKQDLTTVFGAIESDPHAEELFRADPVEYFKSNGIDVDGLSFNPERNPNELRRADATANDLAMVACGCINIGYYACYSEG